MSFRYRIQTSGNHEQHERAKERSTEGKDLEKQERRKFSAQADDSSGYTQSGNLRGQLEPADQE